MRFDRDLLIKVRLLHPRLLQAWAFSHVTQRHAVTSSPAQMARCNLDWQRMAEIQAYNSFLIRYFVLVLQENLNYRVVESRNTRFTFTALAFRFQDWREAKKSDPKRKSRSESHPIAGSVSLSHFQPIQFNCLQFPEFCDKILPAVFLVNRAYSRASVEIEKCALNEGKLWERHQQA